MQDSMQPSRQHAEEWHCFGRQRLDNVLPGAQSQPCCPAPLTSSTHLRFLAQNDLLHQPRHRAHFQARHQPVGDPSAGVETREHGGADVTWAEEGRADSASERRGRVTQFEREAFVVGEGG